MENKSLADVAQTLFRFASRDQESMVVVDLLLDMMVEIEALREAVAACPATRDAYRLAYQETAYLAHDATGPTGGDQKLLARFYSSEGTDAPGGSDGWREVLLMRRLGLSEEEIEAWRDRAAEAELYT